MIEKELYPFVPLDPGGPGTSVVIGVGHAHAEGVACDIFFLVAAVQTACIAVAIQ
jgi:hypothetical protein